jgi:hypothetical protein
MFIKCNKCKHNLAYSPNREAFCGYCGAPLSSTVPKRSTVWAQMRGLFSRRRQPPGSHVNSDIAAKLDRLAAAAWGAREDIRGRTLNLRIRDLPRSGADAAVERMLRHARETAPRLNVPRLVPRITIESLPVAAGQFVEDQGWVKIVVNKTFLSSLPAARAILCHELAHYVLNATGIREASTLANERLTDAAMFVLGLGDIFLGGYRSTLVSEYRPGYRLGYLSDVEYQFVGRYVHYLWSEGDKLLSRDEEAERRLRAAIFDASTRDRLVRFYQSKYPFKPMADIVNAILDDIARDNR